ncbi:LRR receptor-like serine/threonine-protein kinase ERL2 [Gossypium australe]|uniref:LRR receptor-like serine/threonine-protein kinase ERL2 n=1 Tax=Gossypium australe TaxID=47621 RepID=A0A5B6WG32_9ROSI|nr:LRR receptor-like serine/threonine-protein kinase ERL2 [Gossypium australe]
MEELIFPQLTEVTTLEVFSVLSNNLSGPLPDRKNQFGTFEESNMGDLYISFVVSFAIIFLATIIVLYINTYRRRACFYCIEDHSITCYFFIVDSLRRLLYFKRNN